MIKLVAIDLDGTLLNSKKNISVENINAIQRAVKSGVKVVICSGRVFTGAEMYATEVGLSDGPLIGCNGALIKELKTQKLLYSKSVRVEDCLKVVDLCHHQGIYFHAYIGDTLVTESLGFSSRNYFIKNQQLPEAQRIDIQLVKDMEEVFTDMKKAATKFVIASKDAEHLSRVRKIVEEIETVVVVSSDYDNIEIVDREVSKGNALKFIGQMLDIKREEVMAIGDNENDLSMIQYAGCGIAMGNAQQAIKDIADYITHTNDLDGVAKAIEKFVLS